MEKETLAGGWGIEDDGIWGGRILHTKTLFSTQAVLYDDGRKTY